MFGKTLFYILLLVGVGVTPYLLSDHKWLARIEEWMAPTASDPAAAETNHDSRLDPSHGIDPILSSQPVAILANRAQTARPGNAPMASATSRSHVATEDFELPLPHVLSFQATPEWITQNWQSVTNCAGELDLQGWRVPYFRNRPNDDFAGSVTYYFDRARNVQRIVLHGYASTAAEIVQIATGHYGMRAVHSPDSDLYLAASNNQPIGGLQVKFARLLNTEKRNRQCEVLLELNRSNTEYGMSGEFQELIRRNREANYLLTPISDPAY